MIRRVLVMAALLVAAGCDKKQGDAATAVLGASAPGAMSSMFKPWATPPQTKVAEGTGTGFAKVDPHAAPAAAGSAKVDPWAIAPPDQAKVAIKGLGGADAVGFAVTYNHSKAPGHEQLRRTLEANKVFEKVAQGLNNTVRLPKRVDVELVDCGVINAFYDPNSNRLIVCYELLDYFIDVFKPTVKTDEQLGSAVIGATLFTFYHETGHGLIHLLDLPAVGREEDSVDQLATLTLISMGDEGVAMAESGAYWFQLQAKQGKHDTPFWDEHGFDGQRFYNIMCLIYGSNPSKYQHFVSSDALPKERAQRCPEEYAKIDKAWERLLQPYTTNGAAVNLDYKPSIAVGEAPNSTAKDPWGDSPSGDSTPTVNTPTPKPEPIKHKLTCEQVAVRAGELIRAEAEARGKTMTDEQKEDLATRLDSQLPALQQQIIAECAKADWSDAERRCVLEAQSLEVATKCK